MGLRIPEPFRPLADQARAAGWTIEMTGGTHLRWTAPGGQAVISSASPSDRRATVQLTGNLRQAGLAVNGRVSSRQAGRPGAEPPSGCCAADVQTADVQAPDLLPAAISQNKASQGAPADDLRRLITEARQALRDLRQEVQAARKLISDDIQNLVTEEVMRLLRQESADDLREVRDIAMRKFWDANQAEMDRLFRMMTRTHERFSDRLVEADRICTDLVIIRDGMRVELVPSAFRKG